jgi:hypothetical protein
MWRPPSEVRCVDPEGIYGVGALECGSSAITFERESPRLNFRNRMEMPVPRPSPGKLVGLFFGGLVVVVMLFMMFVLLGNLFMSEQ